jgi:hypothetical protein
MKLFATGGYTQLLPGHDNPLQPGLHPDDKWTCDQWKNIFPGTAEYVDSIDYDANQHIFCLGSPQSNAVALHHLQYERQKDGSIERLKNVRFSSHFEYYFPSLEKSELEKQPRIKRYVGGKLSERPPYLMKIKTPLPGKITTGNKSTNWDGDGWLSEDWLVLSKVPNLDKPGKFVIIVGGLHGPGTKASAFLLKKLPLEVLREINDQREGQPYFQSLFHIQAILHDHNEYESRPTTVEHCGTLPLDVR